MTHLKAHLGSRPEGVRTARRHSQRGAERGSEVIGAPQIDQMASLPDRTFLGQGYESHVQMFFSEASGWSCRKVSRVSTQIPIVRLDRGNRAGEPRMMPAWSSTEARNC